MGFLPDNFKKYKITAQATVNGITSYTVVEEGSNTVEIIFSDDIKLLCAVDFPLYDNNMQLIKFVNGKVIGCIEDITDLVTNEDEWEEDSDNEYIEEEEYYEEEDYYEDTNEEQYEEQVEEEEYYEDEYSDEYIETEEEYYEEEYYEDEYYEEEDEEESTVSRLYSYLTTEQIKILKRYYLWYSQRLFTNAQKDPTLGMKSQAALKRKKADLDQLRNTGGMWHYAGFIDTGAKGNGYCTLGHPLRYMQLAWDVTVSDIETAFFGDTYDKDFEEVINSNNCIIFGIKCVGDFFEVDKDCVKALQSAQRDSLKDMAIMCEYYEKGIQDDIRATFTELTKIMKKVTVVDARGMLLNKSYEPILPAKLTAFYLQFEKEGMIPPKSLVQEIRDKLIGWSNHKFTGTLGNINGNIVKSNLGKLFKLDDLTNEYLATKGYSYSFEHPYKFIEVYLRYEICGQYKYDAENNKDEGGRSKQVQYELHSMYDSAKCMFKDIEFTYENLEKVLQFIGLVLECSTFSEKFKTPCIARDPEDYDLKIVDDSYKTQIYKESEAIKGYTDEYGVDTLDLLSKYSSSYNYSYSLSRSLRRNPESIDVLVERLKKDIDKINTDAERIVEYLYKYVKDKVEKHNAEVVEHRRLEAERKLEEDLKAKEKVQEDSIKPSGNPTSSEIVEYLKKADLSTVDGMSFNKQVLDTVVKYGKEPSDKQLKYLRQLYTALTGIEIDGGKPDNILLTSRPDLEEAIDWLLMVQESDERTRQICKSIKVYGKISERQMKYAEEALRLYNESKK